MCSGWSQVINACKRFTKTRGRFTNKGTQGYKIKINRKTPREKIEEIGEGTKENIVVEK